MLAISYIVRYYPTTSLYNYSKLLASFYGLLVIVSRSFPASRVSSCPQTLIIQVSPHGDSLMLSSRLENRWSSFPFRYLMMSSGTGYPIESSPVGVNGSDVVSGLGSEVCSLVYFSLGGPISEMGSAEGGFVRFLQVPCGCPGGGSSFSS